MDINKIPKNSRSCFSIIKKLPNGNYKVKFCPYWKELHKKDECGNPIYYCKYLKQESHLYDSNNLIWDGIKECGVNEMEE